MVGKMALRKGLLAVAVAATCIGPAAGAEESGFYVGALAGSTEFNLQGFDYSRSEFTWGLFTGWQFNKYFAAELGYYKPGDINESFDETITAKNKTHTIATTLIGSYPLNDRWSVFARIGAGFLDVNSTVTYEDDSQSNSGSSTNLLYGGGVEFALQRVRLRLEYERVDADFPRISMISLGVVMPLGK